jgi:phytoene synthase
MLLTCILRDLTQDARRHRLYLPRELLQAHGIFATMPSYVLAQPALPQVCNAVAEWAVDWFADAEDALEGRSRWRMGVVTPILSGYSRLLRALLVRGWDHLDEPVCLPAWCRPALAIGYGLIGR